MVNDDKIKCPFCAEEIKSDAIKCRFCGEWIKKEKLSKSNLLNKPISKTFSLAVIITIFLFTGIVSAFYKDSSLKIPSLPSKPTLSQVTIYPVSSPQVKGVTTTSAKKVVTKPVESDPPVHCQIHEKCGGGTKPLKKSECDNSICCFYPDGAKLVTKQECNSGSSNTQAVVSPSQTPKTNSPISTPYPTIPTIQYPSEADQAAIERRISACKSNCDSTVNNYITQATRDARAGGYGSAYDQIVNSRESMLAQCFSNCR